MNTKLLFWLALFGLVFAGPVELGHDGDTEDTDDMNEEEIVEVITDIGESSTSNSSEELGMQISYHISRLNESCVDDPETKALLTARLVSLVVDFENLMEGIENCTYAATEHRPTTAEPKNSTTSSIL